MTQFVTFGLDAPLRVVPLTEVLLDSAVLPIEQSAFSHPWTRGNFFDALCSGYCAKVLLQERDEVLGYFVAMQILDEVHLLNMTVAPQHQGHGYGLVLLQQLHEWSVSVAGAHSLWLEVRESNARARQVYERYGFSQVGARKKYYPVHDGERETAILMRMFI